MLSTCRLTGKPFTISAAEQAYCEENGIPLPTLHPIERLREMLVFRNRVFLYNTTCALTKKEILSQIPPETGFTVYDVEAWESDQWDPFAYGREYDFNRPFFDQMDELTRQVPLPNLAVIRSTMENSDFTNGISTARNCYLIFSSTENEDCMFSYGLRHDRNVIDCTYANDCELCYGSTNIHNCYNVRFSEDSTNCSDSSFLYNCTSCKNCFGCANLNNKEYYFLNQKLSREEYEQRIKQIDLGSYAALEKMRAQFDIWKKDFPIKCVFGKSNEHSSGNFLANTKNTAHSYFMGNTEDMEYCLRVDKSKSSFFHAMFGNNSELIYNCQSCGENVLNLKFCVECWPNTYNLEYCIYTGYGANNCFGCVGVKKKAYCILNKQYSKEAYTDMLGRIKEHMKKTGEYGQFFPSRLSPYYYNQSEVSSFFPLSKEEALQRGFSWKDETVEPFETSYEIPDHIKDVSDDILHQTLKCQRTGKKYKIIKPELEMYRRMQLPIPRIAPLERIKQKSNFFNIHPLEERSCAKCAKSMQTVYDTNQHKVYCEECYVKEVY